MKMLEELVAAQFGRLESIAKLQTINGISITQIDQLTKQP